jgi:hypothetical protein
MVRCLCQQENGEWHWAFFLSFISKNNTPLLGESFWESQNFREFYYDISMYIDIKSLGKTMSNEWMETVSLRHLKEGVARPNGGSKHFKRMLDK